MFVYFLENNAKFSKSVFRLGHFACTTVKLAAIAEGEGNKDPLKTPSQTPSFPLLRGRICPARRECKFM
jgi:hypothetical protein